MINIILGIILVISGIVGTLDFFNLVTESKILSISLPVLTGLIGFLMILKEQSKMVAKRELKKKDKEEEMGEMGE